MTLREKILETVSHLEILAQSRQSNAVSALDMARADSFSMTAERLRLILDETAGEVLSMRQCENCDGSGEVRAIGRIGTLTCTDCNGSGQVNA